MTQESCLFIIGVTHAKPPTVFQYYVIDKSLEGKDRDGYYRN